VSGSLAAALGAGDAAPMPRPRNTTTVATSIGANQGTVEALEVLLSGTGGLDLPGSLKTEMHASVIELNTGICGDVAEAVASLKELRLAADRVARANGLVVAAAGAHPTASLESLPVVQERSEMIRRVGYAARRQGVNGLRTSVSSAERCYSSSRARAMAWSFALSANSPRRGVNTGMQSVRWRGQEPAFLRACSRQAGGRRGSSVSSI
jgi:gamma-glutamyl:cysteine ligase YbdK (ATP-grasp superfamily)